MVNGVEVEEVALEMNKSLLIEVNTLRLTSSINRKC